jgi:LysM repeat protein
MLGNGGLIFSSPTPLLAQEATNLLENGGLEGEYAPLGGDEALQLAPAWQPWYIAPPGHIEGNEVIRPDYYPSPENRVRTGTGAQEYNTFYAGHDAGIFQRVPAQEGAQLEFSAYVYVWSSASFEDPDESVEPQDVSVQVGIDPTGGQDGASEAIIWSEVAQFYDEYRQLTVQATAEANAITVFVRSIARGAVGINTTYVDDASLIQTGLVTPEPVPTDEATATQEVAEATATPSDATATAAAGTPAEGTGGQADATATPAATGTATAATAATTPAPTATPAVLANLPNRLTYTVRAGDTVFRIATANSSTVEAIVAANGLSNAGLIFVGQALVIPVPANTPNSTGPTATATTTATASTATATSTAPTATATANTGGPLPPANTGTYTVLAGDSLYGIAVRFGTTVETLASLNNITNPNRIVAGTVLRVPATPGGNTGGPVATATPTGNTGTGGQVTRHVVQVGENAFRIGLRYNVTVEALSRANNLSNANLIYAGQVLIIPR